MVRVHRHILLCVVRVSHHLMYQIILSMWSECIAIYRPRGQSVSPFDVSNHIVYISSMSTYQACLHIQHVHHILPMWSECLMIRGVKSHYLHIQHVHHILHWFVRSTWSVCIAIYCACGQCLIVCCIESYCVLPYVAHAVGVSHDILYWFMRSWFPVCIAI